MIKILVFFGIMVLILTMPTNNSTRTQQGYSDIDKISLTNLMSPANIRALQALQVQRSNYDALNEAGLATTLLSGSTLPPKQPTPSLPNKVAVKVNKQQPPHTPQQAVKPLIQGKKPNLSYAKSLSDLPRAMIRNAFAQIESGGEAVPDRAVSSTGARGRYQILPSTGKWIADKIGMKDFHPDKLFNPVINTRMHDWYVDFLSKKYNGDPALVAAAYADGQGTVDRALAKSRVKTFEGIKRFLPGQSKAYVPKFLNNLETQLASSASLNDRIKQR